MTATVSAIVTCVVGSGGIQGPCPAGMIQQVQDAVLIPASEANAMQFLFSPLDPVRAAEIFGFSLSLTVVFWFAAWGVGTIARMVRR